jgi:hypothetical protein
MPENNAQQQELVTAINAFQEGVAAYQENGASAAAMAALKSVLPEDMNLDELDEAGKMLKASANGTAEEKASAISVVLSKFSGIPMPDKPVPLAFSLYIWGDKVVKGLKRMPGSRQIFSVLDWGLREIGAEDLANELDPTQIQKRRGQANKHVTNFFNARFEEFSGFVERTERLDDHQRQKLLQLIEAVEINDSKIENIMFSVAAPNVIDVFGDALHGIAQSYLSEEQAGQAMGLFSSFTKDGGIGKRGVQLLAFGSGIFSAFAPELRQLDNEFVDMCVDGAERITGMLRVGTLNDHRVGEINDSYLSSPEAYLDGIIQADQDGANVWVLIKEIDKAKERLKKSTEKKQDPVYWDGEIILPPSEHEQFSSRGLAWSLTDVPRKVDNVIQALEEHARNQGREVTNDELEQSLAKLFDEEITDLFHAMREGKIELGVVQKQLQAIHSILSMHFSQAMLGFFESRVDAFREPRDIQQMLGTNNPSDKQINRLRTEGFIISENDTDYFYHVPVGLNSQADYVQLIENELEHSDDLALVGNRTTRNSDGQGSDDRESARKLLDAEQVGMEEGGRRQGQKARSGKGSSYQPARAESAQYFEDALTPEMKRAINVLEAARQNGASQDIVDSLVVQLAHLANQQQASEQSQEGPPPNEPYGQINWHTTDDDASEDLPDEADSLTGHESGGELSEDENKGLAQFIEFIETVDFDQEVKDSVEEESERTDGRDRS